MSDLVVGDVGVVEIEGAPSSAACSLWATTDAFVGTRWADDVEPQTLADFLSVATDLLFMWSGRQWPGSCHDVVTIEGPRWVPGDYRGPVEAALRNGWPCPRVERVKLGARNVTSVSSVVIDPENEEAETIAPEFYRVDDWRWLVRLPDGDGRNEGWPVDGTMTVEFVYGAMPPPDGVAACVELAGEMGMARDKPDGCRLPKHVTSYVRAGVSVQVAEPGGFDELPMVRAFLKARNPSRVQRRGGVLNPDIDLPATVSRRNTGT